LPRVAFDFFLREGVGFGVRDPVGAVVLALLVFFIVALAFV
jgi:hypothetical protein